MLNRYMQEVSIINNTTQVQPGQLLGDEGNQLIVMLETLVAAAQEKLFGMKDTIRKLLWNDTILLRKYYLAGKEGGSGPPLCPG